MRFDWDESKNRSNQAKHGISFEEARELFESGLDYLEIFDAEHSVDEDRFLAIGVTGRGLVVVSWADEGDVIRIISARRALRREERLFRERMGEKQ